jgi:tripartite ATP-independent transporter DctM subunit
MGMIIPPSIPMLIYAFVAQESVGRLFLAGALPGVLVGVVMFALTIGISLWKKHPVERVGLNSKEAGRRTLAALPALLMPIFVVGSVVLGITTATESAGAGVLYAVLIGVFVYRGLKLRVLPRLLRDSIMTSASVMLIIAFSQLYIWILAIERVPQLVAAFITGLELPVFMVLLLVDLIIIAIGTFVDVGPAIILLVPILLPAMQSLGVSPIQFGAIMVTGLAVGLVTPPVGMCLNVASAISGLDILRIFRGALPFIVANIVVLTLITLIPALSLWLPALLMK